MLLKNAGRALPLRAGLGSIAVIGPDADNVSAAGGGSGLVKPTYEVSPLEGISTRAGAGVDVQYAPGTDPIGSGDFLPGPDAVPSSVLTPAGGAPGEAGLRAEYWDNPTFAGEPVLVRTDLQANLLRGFFGFGGLDASSPKIAPLPPNLGGNANHLMSVQWTGQLTAPATGDYELSLTNLGSAQLYLDGELLIDNPGEFVDTVTATMPLVAGEPRELRIQYRTDSPVHDLGVLYSAHVRFGWQPPADAVPSKMREAVDLAAASDVAVVVAKTYESEAFLFDRNDLTLPNGQDQLIREVIAANPNSVVVLQSGTPIEMQGWVDRVPAIVQAWYGGQEQGNAIADVLFGDVNPSGKLPITFPVDEQSHPVASPEQFPGNVSGCLKALGAGGESAPGAASVHDCTVRYTEGVMVGYRGYENAGIRPQFPFGHGLSYTTFEYRNLNTVESGPPWNKRVRVMLNVRNTGEVAGSEVVQVYVGRLPVGVETPPKALAGFKRSTSGRAGRPG